jgi:hypothetical protein
MISYRVMSGLAAALLLAGCGSHEAKTGANSAESHAPGTTLASAAGACSSYAAGTPGVIRTFCDGPAKVKLFVGGKEHDLTGGTCETEGPMFTVNLGVVSSADLGGPKPDYFGLTVPAGGGHFSNAVLAVNVDGKAYAVTSNSGDASATGGTFTGAAMGDSAPITGNFTC